MVFIANANNPDYVRRSLLLGELTATATINYQVSSSLSGVQTALHLVSRY